MQEVSRLIELFTPTEYRLSLQLRRVERSFSGVVSIRGDAHSAKEIRLHSKQLTIESATINGHAANWRAELNDELVLTSENLTNGSCVIVLAFSGIITNGMHGMYPCFFTESGEKKELLATQFESHHAREVFPCVDEPEAKATFDVTLTTENNVTVLGNMPIKDQVKESERLITTFERTPRMSSYLLAWVVGELHKQTATTNSGVEVNVWATPNQPRESLDFALDIAVRSIEFYNDYFGVPYPLPKSDHVALPDFSSGAMENWGLITYREVALLADPKSTSVSAKHYIATVIAHELAHQWFGNLVTMKWWNDLWLNESFATLMEYIAVDSLHPEWNVWLDFASNESVAALRRDATDGVQSVQVDVHHPDEISTLFDGAIVYAKGARLLRMLETHIGKDAFRTGLHDYFTEHAYKNTEADDLWQALSASSKKDIRSFMSNWISQPGYPVVTIGENALSQSQFFIGEHEQSSRLWPIPLEANDRELPVLLTTASIASLTPDTLRLNQSDSAHFITHYRDSHFDSLLKTIADEPVISRLQLMHERSLLARAGMVRSASLLALLESYKDESSESVWDIMALTFSELKKFVEDDDAAEAKLRSFSGIIAQRQFERLGWDESEGEAESDTKLRATILSMMLYSEQKVIIDEAIRRYESTPLVAIPAEIRALIISTAVKFSADESIIDTLLDEYQSTASSDLKQDICAGVTATRDIDVVARLLNLSKDSAVIKQQDAFRWFVYLVRSKYGRVSAWQWLQNNWSWVKETFGGDKSYDDYPRYAATGLVSREQLKEYKIFFTPMANEPSLKRTIELGIVEIQARIGLLERDGDSVRAALRDFKA